MTVSAGWCWLVVISAVDVILPIDELIFFKMFFNHQPDGGTMGFTIKILVLLRWTSRLDEVDTD